MITDTIARYRIAIEGSPIFSKVAMTQAWNNSNPATDDISINLQTFDKRVPLDMGLYCSIVKLYQHILQYQAKAVCHLYQPTFTRIVNAVAVTENWSQMVEDVRRLDTECKEYISMKDIQNQSLAMSSLRQDMEHHKRKLDSLLSEITMKEINIQKIRSLISDVVETHDHEEVRIRLGRKYWQSGQWLHQHQEFLAWISSDSAVLWLRGPVGVGKTSLMSTVIHKLSVEDSWNSGDVAFFYCSQHTCQAVDVFRSLLCQLSVNKEDEIATPTRCWFEDRTGQSVDSKNEIYIDARVAATCKPSISECLDLLKKIIESRLHTTLIIDALDECSDVVDLLDGLLKLMSWVPNKIRVMLASRLGVEKTLNAEKTFEINHFASSTDMENFIDSEIDSSTRRARSGMTPGQAAELRLILVSRAKGM